LFTGLELIEVAPAEPFAANALLIDSTVVYPAEHTETRRRLESHGIRVVAVEATEVAKAEGGVTCCSLVFAV
jgi:dimethylargininase